MLGRVHGGVRLCVRGVRAHRDAVTRGASHAQMSSPTTDDLPLSVIRDVAVELAEAAGRLMLAHAGRVAVSDTKSGHQDLVTEVDKACQDLIEAGIAARFPGHAVLGEESVAAGAAASDAALREALRTGAEWLWIADPIDGTTMFVSDLALSVVSIGVAHRGEVVVGVVHNPYRRETFAATRGGGAWLNGARRLAVSPAVHMASALWAYGLGNNPRCARRMLAGVGALIDASRGASSLGSAALHLASVAAGRFEGFFELDLASWDICAGALLVAEAGGRVTDMRGRAYCLLTRDVYATCGAQGVHEEGLRLLAEAHADRLPPREGTEEEGAAEEGAAGVGA